MDIKNLDYNNYVLDLSNTVVSVNSTTLITGMTEDLVDKINSLSENASSLLFKCKARLTGETPITEDISVVLLPGTSTGSNDDVRWYGRCYFNGSDRHILVTFTAPQTVFLSVS